MHVLSETKSSIPKILVNQNIEWLQIRGPCTLNIHLIMKNLRKLEIKLDPIAPTVDCCSYFKSKPNDRKRHRPGLCGVNIGAVYSNCPNLEQFMGLDMKGVAQKWELTFSK